MRVRDIHDRDLAALVDAIHRRYGLDFKDYALSSLRRRVHKRITESALTSVKDLQENVVRDERLFDMFLADMSVTVTTMFRDPDFFRALREHVVPLIKSRPFAKIWHAGCATGEEIYSMAIVLHEEGCLEQSRLFGTDYNNRALIAAERGVFPINKMRDFSKNYYAAGGRADFSDYFCAGYRHAKMHDWLKTQITFAHHNLVHDGPMADIDVVVCRNVLIYFGCALQDRALTLFRNSMQDDGILCLGSGESIDFRAVRDDFEAVSSPARIYRKRDVLSPKCRAEVPG